ncbi:unnamed protein product [Rotaria socialis]|uniref:Uncharacterized protein n=1 Tax=Rotaria socialis TaxID=392032 RepID=A0A818FMS8_9BILA|nr:unnamed protein product [Rotaria socialis]CAF4483844.1 unnamed protein product [Rotaria socialis]
MMATTLPDNATVGSSSSTDLCMDQNVFLLWLDSNIDETNDDCRNSILQIRSICSINIFIDVDECIDFLTEIKDKKAFMIVTNAFSGQIVPLIHDTLELYSIYVLYRNSFIYKQFTEQYPKVKGIFTQIVPIIEPITKVVQQYDQDSTLISFFPPRNVSNGESDQAHQSFMYTQLLKEILLEIEYNEQSPKDFAAYYRKHYPGELNTVDKFERDYYNYPPIYWYTKDFMIHSVLNQALRAQNTEVILKMGYFLHDLHQNIEQLHSDQMDQHLAASSPLIVYRGQDLAASYTNIAWAYGKLGDWLKGLLYHEKSLDIYLNASDTNNLALAVCYRNIAFVHETMGDYSKAKSFNGKAIEQCEKYFPSNQSSSTTHHTNIDSVHENIKTSLQNKKKYLHPNHPDLIRCYNYIGSMYSNMGEYSKAVSYFEEDLEVCRNSLPSNHPDLAISYSNIGSMYAKMAEYTKALAYYGKGLDIIEKSFPTNHPDWAMAYNNIGSVNFIMGGYVEALSNFEKALEIRKKFFPANHRNLAISYNNIGSVFSKMGEYANALFHYEQAIEVTKKAHQPDHRSLAICVRNIAALYNDMGEYWNALRNRKKALEILEKFLPANHLDLAVSYSSIGSVYLKMGEFTNAFSSCKKALDIGEKSFPPNDPDWATCYNNMGSVYFDTGEYVEAI